MPSVGEVVDRIVQLGVVDESTVSDKLDSADLERTLDYFGGLLGLLDQLGIVYSVDYKSFRHACDDDGAGYREELKWIADCTRGLVTITDIALVDDADGDHLLRFRANGEPHEWSIAHGPDEDFDATLEFTTSMGEFSPAGRPERWCTIEPVEPGGDLRYVFADPAALNRLGAEYGLTFEPEP
jgi:hypothetical protein